MESFILIFNSSKVITMFTRNLKFLLILLIVVAALSKPFANDDDYDEAERDLIGDEDRKAYLYKNCTINTSKNSITLADLRKCFGFGGLSRLNITVNVNSTRRFQSRLQSGRRRRVNVNFG